MNHYALFKQSFLKEWRETISTGVLKRYSLVALFTVFLNFAFIGLAFLDYFLELAIIFDLQNVTSFQVTRAEGLSLFNLLSIFFFIPFIIVTNLDMFKKEKEKNLHLVDAGLSKEELIFSKILNRCFLPLAIFVMATLFNGLLSVLLLENVPTATNGGFVTVTTLDVFTVPLALLPLMLFVFSTGILSQTLGKDKIQSLLICVLVLLLLLGLFGLLTPFADGMESLMVLLFLTKGTASSHSLILVMLIFITLSLSTSIASVLVYKQKY